MWSDAARAASMQARGGSQSGLSTGMANAGGKGRGVAGGTHTNIKIGGQGGFGAGAAHQAGVNGLSRNMRQSGGAANDSTAGAGVGYYPNVADSSYGAGAPSQVTGDYKDRVAPSARAAAPGVRHFGFK